MHLPQLDGEAEEKTFALCVLPFTPGQFAVQKLEAEVKWRLCVIA